MPPSQRYSRLQVTSTGPTDVSPVVAATDNVGAYRARACGLKNAAAVNGTRGVFGQRLGCGILARVFIALVADEKAYSEEHVATHTNPLG